MRPRIVPTDEDAASEDKSRNSSIFSKQPDGSGVFVDERLAQTSKTLRYLLDKNRLTSDEAWSETLFGCVLLADISGFTRLSTILNVEQLKHHINLFFTLLLSTVKRFGGDTVKFCGDALIIVWTAPLGASKEEHTRLALTATNCGLAVIETCGSYDKGTPSKPISLRLHCGLSAGPLHCMVVGDKHRMEFLVSGSQLRAMGLAAGDAKMGELCVTADVYDLLSNRFNATLTANQNYLILGETLHCRSSLGANRRTLKSVATAVQLAISLKRSSGAMGSTKSMFSLGQLSMYSIADSVNDEIETMSLYDAEDNSPIFDDDLLVPFMHECTRRSIQLQASEFLAEIRCVVTIFIEILNLDSDFDCGNCAKPQAAMVSMLNVMRSLGGSLRQFVVDDKGCVGICSFGVPGFSYDNNELRAIFTAMGVRDGLHEHGISCRIGIASGNAYCGYVGSRDRKEYCTMGSSVNLAARLMGKAGKQEILVSESVHDSASQMMDFTPMSPVIAKGYDHPINVFSVVKQDMTLDNMRRSSLNTMTVINRLICRSAEIASLRSHLVAHFSTAACRSSSVNIDTSSIGPSRALDISSNVNRRLLVAPEGFGKTLLVQHLIIEEKTFLAGVHRASCHLADIDEAYSTILSICRQLFNIHHSPTSSPYKEDEVREFIFEDTDEQDGYLDVLYHLRTYVASRELCETYIYACNSNAIGNSIANQSRLSSLGSATDDSIIYSIVRVTDGKDRQMYLDNEGSSLHSLLDAVNMLPGCIASCQSLTLESNPSARDIFVVQHAFAYILKSLVETSQSPVLIIEDLHWCDEASFDVLLIMLQSLQRGYFLGTMRPSNSTIAGKYSRAESVMSVADAKNYLEHLKVLCDVIRIQPFSEMQVRVAVESLIEPNREAQLFPYFDDQCINKIYQHSKGVPGAVFEIAQKLKISVIARNSNKVAIDHNIDSNVLHMLDRLSLESQMVLKVAAVCGTKFSVEIVRKVLEEMECPDMSAKVVNAVIEIKRSHLIRRCMPIWDAPIRVNLRSWSERNWSIIHPVRGKRTFLSVAKGIKAIVSMYGDAQNQSVRDAACYAFTDKRIRESVYGVMLADQQKNMHAVIALAVEKEYVRDGVKSDTQLALLKFVAFHYSRAGNVEKDVYYSELIASRLFKEAIFDEAMQYYHHLVEVATDRCDIGDVIRYVTKSYKQARRRSSLLIGNANRQRVMSFRRTDIGENLPKHYLPYSDFVLRLESKCPVIPNAQLCDYLRHMSVIEFRQTNFVLSDTYYKLAKKVLNRPGLSCVRVPSRVNAVSAVSVFESVAAQTELFLMRGDVDSASRMVLQLECLRVTDTTLSVQIAALINTVSMMQGKDDSKVLRRLLASTDIYGEFSRFEMAYVYYHRGAQALMRCDMKQARVYLSKVPHCDVAELLFMCSKHLLAWTYFFSGRINDAVSTIEASKRFVLNECVLYEVWELELRIVIAIMSGELLMAESLLRDMQCKQDGRLGVVYYHALSSIFDIIKAFAGSMNLGDVKSLMTSVTRANALIAQRKQCGPLSVVSMFLCAYTSIMLLQQTAAISQKTNTLIEFVSSLDKVFQGLRNMTSGMPCIRVLTECLLLKVAPSVASLKKLYGRWKWTCNVRKVLNEHKEGNGTCNANYQFIFGGAFLRLEICRAFNITSISLITTNELEVFDKTWRCSSGQFSRYGTDKSHPLLVFMVKKEPVETTDDV